MKKSVLIAVLVTSVGAMAQTPAAPPPMAKPGLTLTTPAFDDGGIIPNKYTQADVMKAMDGHILAKGVLEGRFHRP
jgi:hypothetical protein